MMRRLCLALIALLAAVTPAAAGPTVEGNASYQSVRVPLPPGSWEVVDSVTIPNPRFPNFPIGQQILVSRTGKVVDRMVRITVQRKKQLQDYFTPFRPCEADGYHFSAVADNSGNGLDCWHVRPVSLGLDDDAEPGNALLAKYGKANGLFVPVVMLGARYARLHANDTRYTVEYLWTPDLLSPAPAAAKIWTPKDWTAEAVADDPTRAAVIAAIIAWAKDWRAKIK
jgi:hypothetical protein